jgi:hypothetical protein
LTQARERLKAKANDPLLLGEEAYLLACLGDSEGAKRVLQLYRNLKVPDSDSLFDQAEAYTLLRLGRKDEVLAKLSSCLKEKRTGWEMLHAGARFWPEYDPLRGDPRFEKVLRDTLPKCAKPFDEPAAKAAPEPK